MTLMDLFPDQPQQNADPVWAKNSPLCILPGPHQGLPTPSQDEWPVTSESEGGPILEGWWWYYGNLLGSSACGMNKKIWPLEGAAEG